MMDQSHFLLLLLFVLTIGHLITLKICSNSMDHRTAPVFISVWTLLGLLSVSGFYGHLWIEGWQKFTADPVLLLLAVAKGGLLYLLFVISQDLMKVSLSSRHYVTPMSAGLIAIFNSFLGENLKPQEWVACLGLCALSAAFLFKGHLADMERSARISYFKILALAVVIGGLDFVLTRGTNWFSLLLVSNVFLLGLALFVNRQRLDILKTAFTHRAAILAGVFYAATELVRFYQIVTINPVSVVVTVQAMTKPIILALSAVLWKERTLKEQLAWGILAFAVTMPLIWG